MITQHDEVGARCRAEEDPGHLAGRIEDHIERLLGGSIHYLHVVCKADLITLSGRSETYYSKQSAQEAALDLTHGALKVDNEIVVQ
jgi:hypothetical protein